MLPPADHLLALVIVVGLPLRALIGMRRLRAAPAGELPRLRRALWWRAVASQWGLVAIVLAVWLSRGRDLAALGLELRPTTGLAGVLVGLATMMSLVLRQRGALERDETLRAQVRARLAPVARLLPGSRAEFPRFVVLACTAGLCEELLFRGYLYWYAAQHLPLVWAALAQAIVFGVGHLYQGSRGVLLTGLAGLFFTGVVLVTGSIWPAMLIHALMDLNAGDLALRVPPEEPGGEARAGSGT
jgi:membrane protease YdiL (CAAX protease family)